MLSVFFGLVGKKGNGKFEPITTFSALSLFFEHPQSKSIEN